MLTPFSPAVLQLQRHARAFALKHIEPIAGSIDRDESIPRQILRQLAAAGFLKIGFPGAIENTNADALGLGLVHKEFGKICSSIRSFLTVQDMVARAISKTATDELRAAWLPRMLGGDVIVGLCLSEPDRGSDIRSFSTVARPDTNGLVLNGTKTWTSFGQIADAFLVFASSDQGNLAMIVERCAPGVCVEAIKGLLGLRGSMLARVTFHDCFVPRTAIVGVVGAANAYVSSIALDSGRYSVAWGAIGLAERCLEELVRYSQTRTPFGRPLVERQLIQRLITRSYASLRSAELLAIEAGLLRTASDPDMLFRTSLAKFYAADVAMQIAKDAVQVLGAHGCTDDQFVNRAFRDAKILEIIEGTTQIHEITLSDHISAMISPSQW